MQRTFDREVIHELCSHPRIFPHIADDFITDPNDWTPPVSESIVYLIARDERGPFGFGVFIARTWACWEAHMGFLPRSYGADARASFKQMLRWMWAKTTACRIIGEIVCTNRLAIKFVKSVGFQPYGINPKSTLRRGRLHDQICLGISRP